MGFFLPKNILVGPLLLGIVWKWTKDEDKNSLAAENEPKMTIPKTKIINLIFLVHHTCGIDCLPNVRYNITHLGYTK